MYYKKRDTKPTFFENVVEFVVLLLFIFVIRTVIFGLYQVPTGSMETTMLVGERFLADKLSYVFRNPRRGEIISFNDPEYEFSTNPVRAWFEQYVWGPSNWTKRVIGIPGDTVRGEVEDGKPVIYLNGQKLEEPYLNQHPLIYLWKDNPQKLERQINKELQSILGSNKYGNINIEKQLERRWHESTNWRSYDPTVAYDKQPFYRIYSDRVIKGHPLLEPQTAINRYRAEETRLTRKGSSAQQPDKSFWTSSDTFYVELGPDEYWCMGDNRLGSKDCRFFGPIKRNLIHGRIIFRLFSIDGNSTDGEEDWWIIDLIKHPIDFWTRVRWSRFLQWVY